MLKIKKMAVEQSKIGILVGAPSEFSNSLISLCGSIPDLGLVLLNKNAVRINQELIERLDFLMNYTPSVDPMSDLALGIALGRDVPVVIIGNGERERKMSIFDGKKLLMINPLSGRDLETTMRSIACWIDEVEQDENTKRQVQRFFINGNLNIDTLTHAVRLGGWPVTLSGREFSILSHLADNLDTTVPFTDMLVSVWGEEQRNSHGLLNTNTARLRIKLGENATNQVYVVTVPHIGLIMPKVGEIEAVS